MKKTNLLKGALSVLAVSVLLASCTQVDSRIDTVDTLETPSVKAVAYPGVNYISWNAVKGAVNYKVTRTVDEGVEETVDPSTPNLYVKDYLSVNDVDVEYKVYALSNRNPSSRAVYVYNSNAGSATVTNIFPPVGTKAIDLPKYEKDSGWNFDKDADNKDWKDDFIPTAENIKVELVDGSINVTAPTKVYLTTKVIGYTGNKEEIFYRDDYTSASRDFNEYQNKILSKRSVIRSPGEYKFKATVNALGESLNNAYYEQSKIELNTTITIPAVETSKPTVISEVAYIDNEKTTARVVFTPAVSKDGVTTFAVGNYKVYRALKDSNELVEVTGLKADSNYKNEVIYVVEDKVPSNKVAYDYYVVLNVNGSYENTNNKATLTIPAVETSKATGTPEVAYIDNEKTTARVVFTPAVSKDGVTTFAVENYKVYRALEGSNELVEVTGLKADSRTTSDARTTPNYRTEVIYVVEDKVPSNKVAYDYYVVLNVNGSFEEKKATLTIPAPVVETSKATGNPEVSYIDNEKTTARVVFTPAVSKDGLTTFAVENYKVYRALNGSNEFVEVTGLKADSRTSGNKTEVIYVVEDKVPSNKVAYDYYVVLNVNGSFENTKKTNTLWVENFDTANSGSIQLKLAEFGDDKLRNDVVANVKPSKGSSKIVSVAYAYSTTNDGSKVLDSAYKPLVVVPELAEIGQAFLIENVPENNYVFVKAEFAEIVSTGKVNSVAVKCSEKYTVGKLNDVSIEISTPSQKKGDTDLLYNDWIGNGIDVNGGEIVSVKYGYDKDPELAKVKAINGTEVTFEVKDYNQGSSLDYTFDIINVGEVGDYLAIAVEVKAKEGDAKNYIKVQESTSYVKVSGELPISIGWGSDRDETGTKVTKSLKVYLYKDIFEATNTIDNYDTVEISYIATDSSYRIDEKAEWKKLDPIKVKDFESDPRTDSDHYHRSVNIAKQTYDSAEADTDLTDYYVIKVVAKYNVSGAKEKTEYFNTWLDYMVKK